MVRALLLQIFQSIRSVRQLIAQPDYNLSLRWFIGINMAELTR
jgi:transposase